MPKAEWGLPPADAMWYACAMQRRRAGAATPAEGDRGLGMAVRTQQTYEHLLYQVGKLGPMDKLRLLESLAAQLREEIDTTTQHSITELRGLGKGIWQGMDAQEYVDRERASWNG